MFSLCLCSGVLQQSNDMHVLLSGDFNLVIGLNLTVMRV